MHNKHTFGASLGPVSWAGGFCSDLKGKRPSQCHFTCQGTLFFFSFFFFSAIPQLGFEKRSNFPLFPHKDGAVAQVGQLVLITSNPLDRKKKIRKKERTRTLLPEPIPGLLRLNLGAFQANSPRWSWSSRGNKAEGFSSELDQITQRLRNTSKHLQVSWCWLKAWSRSVFKVVRGQMWA